MSENLAQSKGFRLQASQLLVRLIVRQQAQQFARGRHQSVVGARVHLQQVTVADDLVEPRGAFKRADLLEHQLVVARAVHAMNDQLFAAVRQATHLNRGVDDRKQQRRCHEREADQHEPAQGPGTQQAHGCHSSSVSGRGLGCHEPVDSRL